MTVPAAGEVEGFDRAGELVALAAGLMAAWRRDPSNAVLAREARATLLAIPADAGEDDPLAELRALMGPS